MKVGKSRYEISGGLKEIWRIIEDEFAEPIEWIEADDWIRNDSYLLPLSDGGVDVIDDTYTIEPDRWKQFRFRIKCFLRTLW